MANGAKVAMAVGAGYLLGRTRKMRLAFMLAAAGVTGKFPARTTDLVAQGLSSLGASGELAKLTDQLRGELLDTAKAAALAAAISRVDALNDRLQGVTSAVDTGEVLDDVGGTVEETAETVGRPVGSPLAQRQRRPEAEDDFDEVVDIYDEADEEEPLDVDDDEDFDEGSDLDDEDVEEEPEPEESLPKPPVRRSRATRPATAPRTSARRSAGNGSLNESRIRAARGRPTATATKRAPVRRGR